MIEIAVGVIVLITIVCFIFIRFDEKEAEKFDKRKW